MKRTPATCLLFLAFACTACQVQKPNGAALAGRWEMTASLVDIGDGKGTWQPAASPAPFIEFGTDSSFRSGPGAGYSEATRYAVSDSVLILKGPGSTEHRLRFRLRADTLELLPPCIEACGFRYARRNRN